MVLKVTAIYLVIFTLQAISAKEIWQIFFSHENHPWPPSLSDNGQIRLPTKKSDLVGLLNISQEEPPTKFDVKVFDGTAIVHMLPTNHATTFNDYSCTIFIPWLQQQIQNTDRLDIVWDLYKNNSLKETTRIFRGTGIRTKVEGKTKLPAKFSNFLLHPQNKKELFNLLTEKVASINHSQEKEVYITSGVIFYLHIIIIMIIS